MKRCGRLWGPALLWQCWRGLQRDTRGASGGAGRGVPLRSSSANGSSGRCRTAMHPPSDQGHPLQKIIETSSRIA